MKLKTTKKFKLKYQINLEISLDSQGKKLDKRNSLLLNEKVKDEVEDCFSRKFNHVNLYNEASKMLLITKVKQKSKISRKK